MKVRLILGDQLNHKHSWFETVDDEVLYFMAEMEQETNYVRHHIQKVVAFFSAMRNFAKELQANGHRVMYYSLDDKSNTQSLTQNLTDIFKTENATSFEYQLPDEYRLDQQLIEFCEKLSIETASVSTEHFLTDRNEVADFFEGKKQFTMEYFYRYMRKKYDLMMVDAKTPEGGQWNFDQSNRKKWTGKHLIPPKFDAIQNVSELVSLLRKRNIETIGNINEKQFSWPVTRKQCLKALDYFCENLLVHFGDYQDAMHTDQYYLFHSNLSFAMNSKLLHPLEVVETVINYWRKHEKEINISQVEGFVRQIIGWREYMRGMYWMKMPDYKNMNKLQNTNPLPSFYWTGNTKMQCLQKAISQSLQTAYAHHIQRLMVTGNYALLTQTHPDAVDQWYLGIYIDAIEWVEITNTRGMSQFADGGLVATKPYVSSGSYINKMSNYCKGCHYKVSVKTGEKACPFNSLYWNFLHEKRSFLQNNQRMRMMFSTMDKMDRELLEAHITRAQHIIEHPNDY